MTVGSRCENKVLLGKNVWRQRSAQPYCVFTCTVTELLSQTELFTSTIPQKISTPTPLLKTFDTSVYSWSQEIKLLKTLIMN